jgi:hypothetical protein
MDSSYILLSIVSSAVKKKKHYFSHSQWGSYMLGEMSCFVLVLLFVLAN